MFGREGTAQSNKEESDVLYDSTQGAAIALIIDTVSEYISEDTAARLWAKGASQGSRFIKKKIPSELAKGDEVRTATSWISSPLMIGGMEVSETDNRGTQFTPAIVQWASDK